MSDWKAVKDVGAFLNERGTFRTGPHRMDKKILHWSYCRNCGLIALKNDATRKALKVPCRWED